MPEESSFHRSATAVLFVCIAALVAVKLSLIFFEDYFVYTTWADRALARAQNLTREFQVYGAEYSARQGARTPGGALYYFIYVLIGLNESPLFVYAVAAILHFASTILIFATGRNLHSRVAGMIAVGGVFILRKDPRGPALAGVSCLIMCFFPIFTVVREISVSLIAGQLAWALLLVLYGVVVYTVPIYVIVWCLKEEEARQADSDTGS